MYTGQAEVAEEGMAELLLLADQLEIDGLKSDDEGELKSEEEDVSNVVGLFESQDGTDQSRFLKIKTSNDTFCGIPDVAPKNIHHISKETRQLDLGNKDCFDPKHPGLERQK